MAYAPDFGIAPEFDNVPQEIRHKKFCVWRARAKGNGKFDKIPHNAKGAISTTKPEDFMTFDAAVELYNSKEIYNGIGMLVEKDGYVVVDLDRTDSIPEEIVDSLGPTYFESSPSGNGLRMIYKTDVRPTADLTSPYEIYSGNTPRFVTITGVTHADYPIAHINGEASKLVDKYKGNVVALPVDRITDNDDDPFVGLIKPDFSEKELCDMLKHIDPDSGHDIWLKVMMGVHHFYDGSDRGRKLIDKWSQSSEDYDAREISLRYKSLGNESKRGMPQVTAATIRKIATTHGYDPKTHIDDRLNDHQKEPTEQNAEAKQKRLDALFRPMTPDLLENQPHTVRWLIKDVMEKAAVGSLFGPSGVGKSFAAISMACCIASGQDWLGHKVKQGDVLYLAGEGFSGVTRRVQGWRQEHGNPDLSGLVVSQRAINFGVASDIDIIIDMLEHPDYNFVLIIIDTLARATAGMSENDAHEMGPFMERLSAISRKYDVTNKLVHHTGKQNQQEARGSSAIKGALDFEMRMTGAEGQKGAMLLECNKMKDAEEFEPIGLRLIQTQLPANFNDEDGNTTNTAFIQQDDTVAEQGQTGKLSATGRKMLAALEACLADRNLPKPACPPSIVQAMGMDAPAEGVWVSDLKEKYHDMNSEVVYNTRKQQVGRGLDDLKDKGYVAELNEVVVKIV